MSIKSGKAMAKAFKKGMGKLTLPRDKKKEKKAAVIEGDDYWEEKPKWNLVFDEDVNEASQADFISTENEPAQSRLARPVAQSARPVAQSARKRPDSAQISQVSLHHTINYRKLRKKDFWNQFYFSGSSRC